jgi:hypothetical protein
LNDAARGLIRRYGLDPRRADKEDRRARDRIEPVQGFRDLPIKIIALPSKGVLAPGIHLWRIHLIIAR